MVSDNMPLRRTGWENTDCLHIRGEILKDFSAQVQQKPVLRTGFWSAFSHPVRLSGIVAISNDPSAVPTAHYIQQIAAHLTVKARPARTLGIAGSEKRKSFLMVEKNTLRWEAACGSTLLGSEGGFG